MAENAGNANATNDTQAAQATQTTQTTQGTQSTQATTQNTQTATNTLSVEEFNKRLQSEKDKAMADYGKRIAEMQKELETMRKEKMSAEQLKQFEDEQKQKALEEKDRLLTERENRLLVIDELTKANMYDGGDKTTAFVNLAIKGENAEEIVENVKVIKSYVDALVAKRIDETFKANGRTPNGGSKGEGGDKSNIATQLGKNAAERAERSKQTRDYYINGGR